MKRMLVIGLALALTCFLAAVPESQAGVLNIVGIGDPNDTATLDFNIAADILTISATNTSALFNPVVTGFWFNLPDGVVCCEGFTVFEGAVDVSLEWALTASPNGLNTPLPLGNFDVRVDSSNTPNSIFPGETFVFTFDLAGDTTGLTQDDFITALSFDEPGPPENFEVVAAVRFQQTGPDGEGSDVGVPVPDGQVPEPTTLLILGTGLGLVALGRRRFKK